MKQLGKNESDISFINIHNPEGRWEDVKPLCTDWKGFIEYSKSYKNYDDGFGGANVEDVFIVFDDGSWLERGEYDGSEWWEYKITPTRLGKE